jgi:hypothetical protein
VDNIQTCLDELPALAGALKAFLGGSMKIAYESKVSRTPEPSSPLNLPAFTLLEDIDEAQDFANGHRIADLVTRPPEIFQVWVKGCEQKIYLDGVDRALRIRRVHRKASGMVGLHRVWQRRHAPCPRCEMPTLGGWVGGNTVECTNSECQHRMPLAEYEQQRAPPIPQRAHQIPHKP